MLKFALALLFIALVLLIMRISQLNDKIAMLDEQTSDFVTHTHMTEIIKNLNPEEMEKEVAKLRKGLSNK